MIAVYRAVDSNKVIEIKYNKREIVIGMSCFLVAAVCLNQSNMLTIATCFLFAIVYNITQNIQIIKKIVRKFLKAADDRRKNGLRNL